MFMVQCSCTSMMTLCRSIFSIPSSHMRTLCELIFSMAVLKVVPCHNPPQATRACPIMTNANYYSSSNYARAQWEKVPTFLL